MGPSGMRIVKVADRSKGKREPRRGEDGKRFLVNPDTGKRENWPLAGMHFDGKPPDEAIVPHSFVMRGIDEGWIEATNYQLVNSPGGSMTNPWDSRKVHNFPKADHLTFKCMECGNVKYKVVKSPGKYYNKDGAQVGKDNMDRYGKEPSEVVWEFHLKKVS